MSAFNFDESIARARERGSARRPRRDRGTSRYDPAVESRITELLSGRERPSFSEVHAELRAFCAAHGHRAPTRSSLYNAVSRVDVPAVRWEELPEDVVASLYNAVPEDPSLLVPGDQVVFYAFNYGAPRALSYASAMPWLCLLRADARRGWRPKSHALLRAVMRFRGIR